MVATLYDYLWGDDSDEEEENKKLKRRQNRSSRGIKLYNEVDEI